MFDVRCSRCPPFAACPLALRLAPSSVPRAPSSALCPLSSVPLPGPVVSSQWSRGPFSPLSTINHQSAIASAKEDQRSTTPVCGPFPPPRLSASSASLRFRIRPHPLAAPHPREGSWLKMFAPFAPFRGHPFPRAFRFAPPWSPRPLDCTRPNRRLPL